MKLIIYSYGAKVYIYLIDYIIVEGLIASDRVGTKWSHRISTSWIC